MADHHDTFRRLGKSIGQVVQNHARAELMGVVDRFVPGGAAMPAVRTNPGPQQRVQQGSFRQPGGPRDEDDQPAVPLSPEEMPEYLAFEGRDADSNKRAAVAAWRMIGVPIEDPETSAGDDNYVGDIVAQEQKSGYTFMGPESLMHKYAEEHGLENGEWLVWDDPDAIMSMPHDQRAIRECMRALHVNRMAGMDQRYRDFHWKDQAQGAVFKDIPGISVPLTFLGTGEEILYAARKDGKVEPYVHEFGEESGIKPSVYTDPTGTWLLIHGGNMTVQTEGIRD